MSGTFLAFQRVGVKVLAGEPIQRCDQVGADALRDEVEVIGRLGIGSPGAAIGWITPTEPQA